MTTHSLHRISTAMATKNTPLTEATADDELATERKSLLFTPSEWAEITEMLEARREERGLMKPERFATLAHDLVLNLARGRVMVDPAEVAVMSGTNQLRIPQLSAIPCGPQDELFATDKTFVLSEDVADELEAREKDFVARATGISMEGAHIQEGDLLCLRPLNGRPPSRFDIVVAVTVDEDRATATLKRVTRASPLGLEDGDGNPVQIDTRDGVEIQIPFKLLGVVGKR